MQRGTVLTNVARRAKLPVLQAMLPVRRAMLPGPIKYYSSVSGGLRETKAAI